MTTFEPFIVTHNSKLRLCYKILSQSLLKWSHPMPIINKHACVSFCTEISTQNTSTQKYYQDYFCSLTCQTKEYYLLKSMTCCCFVMLCNWEFNQIRTEMLNSSQSITNGLFEFWLATWSSGKVFSVYDERIVSRIPEEMKRKDCLRSTDQ